MKIYDANFFACNLIFLLYAGLSFVHNLPASPLAASLGTGSSNKACKPNKICFNVVEGDQLFNIDKHTEPDV